jgi:hypothetical protein
LHFGVGAAEVIDRVEVQWPTGTKQIIEKVKTNQLLEVREGSGLKAQGPEP